MEVGITNLTGFVEVTEDEIEEYMDHPVAKRKADKRETPLRDEAARLAASAKLRGYDGFDPRSFTTKSAVDTEVPIITGVEDE